MKRLTWILASMISLGGIARADEHDAWKDAPLMLAIRGMHPRSAQMNQLALVREILSGDPQAIERATGPTGGPLLSAVGYQDAALVGLLLEHGADPGRSGLRETVLHRAVAKKQAPIVELLLAAGAQVRQRDFVRAVHDGSTRCMELLLAHGAQADARDDSGTFPVEAAAEANRAGALGFLLGRGARVSPAEARRAPLVIAARYGHAEIVRMLLDHGAPVDSRDGRGRSAAELAVLGGHEDVLRLLVGGGAERSLFVDVALASGFGGLAAHPPEELASARLAGETLLHAAVRFGQLEATRDLLAHGVDADVGTGYVGTPLHVAARRGDLALVRLLLDHGVEVNVANDYGETPLYAAAGVGHDLLWRRGTLARRAASDALALVRLLLDHGADVNARLSPTLYVGRNWQPLHAALRAERLDVAVALIRGGAETEWEDAGHLFHGSRHRDLLAEAIERAGE